jgi:acetyl esterase/lipase
VPIDNAYQLFQGLIDQGVPVRFYVYKNMTHGIGRPKTLRAVMEHNLNWFNTEARPVYGARLSRVNTALLATGSGGRRARE